MNIRTMTKLALGVTAAIGLATGAAFAQFPSKVVTIIVPYAAGGPTDVAARIIADEMTKSLGKSVIVENRPGAGTVVGAEAVARADKDGHTLFITAATTFSSNPHTVKDIRYKIEDFAPISMLAEVPFVFAVTKDFPAKDIQEFIAKGKETEGGIDFGTLGAGTVPHIIGGVMEEVTGVKLMPIPYGGAAPILADILGGNLDSYIASVADGAVNHKEGNYRVLAAFSNERVPQLPEIPTFKEVGYEGLALGSWFAAFAPAGTPDDVISTLNKSMVDAVASPAYQEKMLQLGNKPVSSTAAEAKEFVENDSKLWGELIKKMGVEAK